MFLRTKIFRQLVLFALIPSVIIAALAYYFLQEAIDQTSTWLAVSSPDRTINSLRLTETRLQETARRYLESVDSRAVSNLDSLLDWRLVLENGRTVDFHRNIDGPVSLDSVLQAGRYEPGMIRHLADRYLIIGAAVQRDNWVIAGGFVFDREYLDGFRAVSATLKESRRFQNLLPGFILFLFSSANFLR